MGPMKILVAVDSFKDCLSSKAAGEAIRKGILLEEGSFDVQVIPMADGGEGTAEALLEAKGGKVVECRVFNPLMRKISSSIVILEDGNTAVIEMAKASGIELLAEKQRNPWVTSTYGTGELIIEALNRGCKRIIIAIGGSATNDAGVGMAFALGAKFSDEKGNPVGHGGGELARIRTIDISSLDRRLSSVEIMVACDVTNPLTGPNGTSYVYAPQKGADPTMVKELESNMKHFARLVKEQIGMNVDEIPSSGAAGGLGAGLLAFTNSKLNPGFEIVRQETMLDEHIKWADLVITGEGKIDVQTQYGKTPMGVVQIAKLYEKPVIAFAGTLGKGYEELYNIGFDVIFSILDKPLLLNEALILAPQLLTRCARNSMRMIKLTSKLKSIL